MKDPEGLTKTLRSLVPAQLALLSGGGHQLGLPWARFIKYIILIVVVALVAGPAVLHIQQEAPMLKLLAVMNRLPQAEQLKPIPCSRTPPAGGPDKAALQEAVIYLARPTQRATAFCLLGDYPSALAAYTQAASAGDDWSALQAYFLQARQGDMSAAEQALSSVHSSPNDLLNFSNDVTGLKLNIDVLPVARRAVELYPSDPNSWRLWRAAALQYQNASDWQRALDAYLEAIRVQEKVGVKIGRSSFELRAGRIYQTQLKLFDLNSALSYYNGAIADMNFLDPGELSIVYQYRGEVYLGLHSTYTASQALQEFLHSLDLNPKNYWAMYDIANLYLNNLKDYSSAESYINQAIGLYPDYSYFYITRGDLYRAQGNLPGAILAYQDALTLQPGYQPFLDRLAAAQAALQKQSP